MKIEEAAIGRILDLEPQLKRTPAGNAGFDLYEEDALGAASRWVEVKAMTGSLADRPVGLSRTQFDLAVKKGGAYWLYIVERADDDDQFKVLRIQDPATRTRTFTFDRGWVSAAQLDPPEPA